MSRLAPAAESGAELTAEERRAVGFATASLSAARDFVAAMDSAICVHNDEGMRDVNKAEVTRLREVNKKLMETLRQAKWESRLRDVNKKLTATLRQAKWESTQFQEQLKSMTVDRDKWTRYFCRLSDEKAVRDVEKKEADQEIKKLRASLEIEKAKTDLEKARRYLEESRTGPKEVFWQCGKDFAQASNRLIMVQEEARRVQLIASSSSAARRSSSAH